MEKHNIRHLRTRGTVDRVELLDPRKFQMGSKHTYIYLIFSKTVTGSFFCSITLTAPEAVVTFRRMSTA